MIGQTEYAYLRPEWVDSFTSDPNAFQFVDCEISRTEARFAGNRKRYAADLPRPPLGPDAVIEPNQTFASFRTFELVHDSTEREQQILLGRQDIFDGTWWKAPSMGWMFVPLTEYQGGGAAATT